ncbi:MAG: lyase family protein [Candidatus Alcyoniella australis]|nr:lyase family protein [Candidatus Alcyoniella australis]
MSRLWEKGTSSDPLAIEFAAGRDPELDPLLVPYDCVASAAHAAELQRIGVLKADEAAALRRELGKIRQRALDGKFRVPPELEDGHTAIESALTKALGALGGKIHAGRSRNDQVSAAIRLFLIDALSTLEWSTLTLATTMLGRAQKMRSWIMPGFTHLRRAMPSTAGMWFAGFAERLIDDCEGLRNAQREADHSPMGSAAGYGSPLPLSRPRMARQAGFTEVSVVPTAVQLSRGRAELSALAGAHGVSLTLSRFGADVVLFTSEEFGLLRLPVELTTGSSIMPQKRNPDIAECLRPVAAMLGARYAEVAGVISHLPSGYQRDMAFTKAPMIDGLLRIDQALSAALLIAQGIQVDREACAAAVTPDVWQAHRATELAARGVPFREAYKQVAQQGADEDYGRKIEEPQTAEIKALRERVAALRRGWRRLRMRIERTTNDAFEV